MEPRTSLTPGQPVTVAPGVCRIVAPNAGMMTGPGTNTYLLGLREIAVVAPGPDLEAPLPALLRAAQGWPRNPARGWSAWPRPATAGRI